MLRKVLFDTEPYHVVMANTFSSLKDDRAKKLRGLSPLISGSRLEVLARVRSLQLKEIVFH